MQQEDGLLKRWDYLQMSVFMRRCRRRQVDPSHGSIAHTKRIEHVLLAKRIPSFRRRG